MGALHLILIAGAVIFVLLESFGGTAPRVKLGWFGLALYLTSVFLALAIK